MDIGGRAVGKLSGRILRFNQNIVLVILMRVEESHDQNESSCTTKCVCVCM